MRSVNILSNFTQQCHQSNLLIVGGLTAVMLRISCEVNKLGSFSRISSRAIRMKPIRPLPVPIQQKLLTIAILGVPNVGKSVILNSMVKARLAAATRKRHTTRSEILGVFNHRNVQLAFYDCPGFVPSFDALRQDMKALRSVTTAAATDVDVVLIVVGKFLSSNMTVK
jgi:ribosome biogenesis GTPase A